MIFYHAKIYDYTKHSMKHIPFFISLMLCNFIVNAQTKTVAMVQFKAMSNAVFISQPYIQTLQKTKSSAITQATENKLIQIFFLADGIKNNSIELDGWTLNEGGYGFTIYFKPGFKNGTWKTNAKDYYNAAVSSIDIGFSFGKKDTVLVLYHYSKAKKLLSRTNFLKSNATFSTGGYSGYLHYQVNKTLLAGKWTGNDMNVEFNCEGKVNGFNDAVKYEMELFTIKPTMQDNKIYDAVTFTNATGNTKNYLWLMEENKLLLYERLDKGNYMYKPGKLLYTLVKNE